LTSTKTRSINGRRIPIYGKFSSTFLVKLYALLEEGIGQRGNILCVSKGRLSRAISASFLKYFRKIRQIVTLNLSRINYHFVTYRGPILLDGIILA
jgi:hypothetical protein